MKFTLTAHGAHDTLSSNKDKLPSKGRNTTRGQTREVVRRSFKPPGFVSRLS